MTVTKKTISECFANLRKFGYNVYNFNSQKKMIRGIKGFSDFMITGHGHIFFIEVKLGKDKFSAEQEAFKDEIKYSAERNPFVFYVECSEKNYLQIHEAIFLNNYKLLK
jgi:hypothetical protein